MSLNHSPRPIFKILFGVAVVATIVAYTFWTQPSPAFASTVSDPQAASHQSTSPIDGNWAGTWLSFDSGSTGYEALMTLTTGANNSVNGQIKWTLRRSPRSNEQRKIGFTAVEFIQGSYNPTTRILRVEGYSKTDPDTVIGIDKYQLILADNNNVIGGITSSGGSWQGVFSTVRQP